MLPEVHRASRSIAAISTATATWFAVDSPWRQTLDPPLKLWRARAAGHDDGALGQCWRHHGKRFQSAPPVHDRHLNVHQDGVEPLARLDAGEDLSPIADLLHVEVPSKAATDRRSDREVVIRDQDAETDRPEHQRCS
jgi:hypothetical protein